MNALMASSSMTKNLNSSFRQVADARHALPDDIHVFLRGLVVVQAQRLDDFLVILLDGLLFTLHGTHDHVLAAGRRIAGAAAQSDTMAAMQRRRMGMRFI